MLMEKERARREAFEQEVLRLPAGLARQNERITRLEQENADFRRLVADQGQMMAAWEQPVGVWQQACLAPKER
jgi:hypothetical protein